jgi:hypothetical protein
MQHNRSGPGGGSFTVLSSPFVAVVSGMHSSYLGANGASRNEPTSLPAKDGNPKAMTTFDKREEAFEKKFVIDEELRFKAVARRNRMLGMWVAEQLGKSGAEAQAYAKDVVAAEIDAGDPGVIAKVMADLSAGGVTISEADLLTKMDEWMAQSIAQVRAGM